MAADVTFIMGRAGVGKTEFMISRIKENEAAGRKSIFIVSDRANFEMEKRLSAALGHGIINTYIVSFTSLARRVLRDTGDKRTFLSMQGRRMLLRRTIDENTKSLGVFARIAPMPGFTGECDEMILKCKRFGITPDELAAAAEEESLPVSLRDKLRDFALIYERTAGAMAEEYIDDEDIVNSLINRLPDSSYRTQDFFIDTPETLTEQSLRIFEMLFTAVPRVMISFRGDTSESCRDRRLFEPDAELYRRARDTAAALGCRVEFISLRGNKRTRTPELLHLESELFAYPCRSFDDGAPAIELHTAGNRISEAASCAEAIHRAVRGGMRYRDIGVIVGDMEAYSPPLQKCFYEYAIPFYMDVRRPLFTQPAAELLLAAIDCCLDNFRAESFIRAVKTGLFDIDPSSIELLENHILKFGLCGNALIEPFRQAEVPQPVEEARMTAAEALLHLKENISGRISASERLRALYDFLIELQLDERLKTKCEAYSALAEFDAAREAAQVFDTIIELFDQLNIILGGAKPGLEKFRAILAEGLRAYTIGTIPTTLDQVIIGDIDNSALTDKEFLLVLGMNEGLIPKAKPDNAIINDFELRRLKALGLPVWQSTERMNRAENLHVYSALMRCKRRLRLSYCSDSGGEASAASPLLERIRSSFPKCRQSNGILEPTCGSTEQAQFARLTSELRRGIAAGAIAPELCEAYSYFADNPRYAAKLSTIEGAYFDGNNAGSLSREDALRLYGSSLTGSPTRLEIFNKCPYRYFLEFGMELKEREIYEEKATDRGSFIHEALDRLITGIVDDGVEFESLDDEAVAERMKTIAGELAASHNNGIYLSSARMRAELRRLIELITIAGREIVRQIAAGKFRPLKSEVGFGRSGDILPALTIEAGGVDFRVCGIVDRLDAFTSGRSGNEYLRIIDYKSSDTPFDFTELVNGIRLQLPLYAAAMEAGLSAENRLKLDMPAPASRAEGGSVTAGFYYQKIGAVEPNMGGLNDSDLKKLKSQLAISFKLHGLTLDDAEVLSATEAGGSGHSSIVNALQFKKDGGAAGNLANPGEMERTKEFAKLTAARTLDAIMRGRIEISPCKRENNATSCKYCAFGGVCAFDTTAGGRYRRLRSVTADDFFERGD